ncbi:MAG: hypothetical protein U0X39_11715 [Bacteroidales bacterium]
MELAARVRSNLYTYLFFILIAAVGILYGNTIAGSEVNLRIWTVGNLLLMLVGVPFLFVQKQAGLPDFLDAGVSGNSRFIFPMLAGIVFGFLDLIVFRIILHPEPYDSLPPFLQPFPYSIFLYFSGAFEVEVFYRLIPITIFGLAGRYFMKGRYKEVFLVAAIILTSVREPLEQIPSGSTWLITYSLVTGYAMNLLQAIMMKRNGFLSSLSVRLGHYLVWHILLGIHVQFIEL